jgi:hypothetical protein
MTQRTANSNKAIGGLLTAAMASGMFIASALGSVPTANATCASFWGIGNGNGCTSTVGGMAIAIGTGATASAEGFFSTAMALGNHATAAVTGPLSLGVAAGTTSHATVGVYADGDFANVGITLGDDSDVFVGSMGSGTFGNIATNLGNHGFAAAGGGFNIASSVGGTGNTVEASTNPRTIGLNMAFALFGHGNTVYAFPGPLAIAGSIFQTNQTITKTGPGININGIKVGGAAAPTKAAASSGNKTKGHAATATKHASKK